MLFNTITTVSALSIFSIATNALAIPLNPNSQLAVDSSSEAQVAGSIQAEGAHNDISERDSVVGGTTFTGTSTCTGDCPGSAGPLGKRQSGSLTGPISVTGKRSELEHLEERQSGTLVGPISVTPPSDLSQRQVTGTLTGPTVTGPGKRSQLENLEQRQSVTGTGPISVTGKRSELEHLEERQSGTLVGPISVTPPSDLSERQVTGTFTGPTVTVPGKRSELENLEQRQSGTGTGPISVTGKRSELEHLEERQSGTGTGPISVTGKRSELKQLVERQSGTLVGPISVTPPSDLSERQVTGTFTGPTVTVPGKRSELENFEERESGTGPSISSNTRTCTGTCPGNNQAGEEKK